MARKEGRRKFLNYVGIIMISPFIILFYFMFRKDLDILAIKNSTIIDVPISLGFHNYDDFFVIVEQENIDVFSSKCTHLGCKLLEKNDTELICPCHGSKFSKSGNLINGPATKNLKKLDYTVDKKKGRMRIYSD